MKEGTIEAEYHLTKVLSFRFNWSDLLLHMSFYWPGMGEKE